MEASPSKSKGLPEKNTIAEKGKFIKINLKSK